MSPEEIAALRLMATTSGLVSLTGKELSTLLLERDHHAAEAKALREAAEALVDTLTSNGGGRECSRCFALATVGEPLPRGGSIFRCDRHASPPDPGDDAQDPCPTKVAAPLRALRALLGRTP